MADKGTSAENNAVPQEKTKKSIGKTIAVLLLTLVILLIIALAAVIVCRDSIIRTTTCKVGSFLTGTEVKLQDFSTELNGKVRIRGFSVGNPAGYSDRNAIELKDIQVDVDIPSLLTDTIKVNLISVSGMKVNFETKPGGNNLKAIQDHLNSFSQSKPEESGKDAANTKPESAKADEPQSGADADKAQKKIFIAKLDAADNSVSVTSHTLNQSVTLLLPPIHLKDVGGKSISETLSEICSQLIASVSQTAGHLGEAVRNAAEKSGKAVADEAKSLGKNLKKSSSDFLKSFKKSFK